jgi:hypothetical protein
MRVTTTRALSKNTLRTPALSSFLSRHMRRI